MSDTGITPVNKAANVQAQKDQLMARYPAFKGLFNGNAEDMAKLVSEFGQDLVNLLLSVVEDGKKKPENRQFDFSSQAGLNAWDAKIAATNYYQTSTAQQRSFELSAEPDKAQQVSDMVDSIASTYGDLRLSRPVLEKIANQALRKGYKVGSISLDHIINTEALATLSAADPTRSALAGSNDVNELMTIAKNYGYTPGDITSQIESILTGKPYNGVVLTKDGFTNMAKQQAIGMYSHLKDRIDAGSSLEDIFAGYRNKIASILELDPKSVMITDPKYAKVLGTADTGQMSLADVETMIKTDERYGYQYTKKANKDGLSIGTALAKMFGEYK
jgi:hypothetical protein